MYYQAISANVSASSLRTWRLLVGCVGSYTGRCFSEDRREAFQKGAGGALASVNALCTQLSYQKEYLGHAPCIKATLTHKDHCGMYYERMVANTEVSPHTSDKANICCAHHMFRECVIREAKQNCDPPDYEIKRISETRGQKWPNGIGMGTSSMSFTDSRTASQFAQQVLDQALNFIMDQCRQYALNSKDCIEEQNGIEKNAAKSNKTAKQHPMLSLPVVPTTDVGSKIEHVTVKPQDDGHQWLPEREEGTNGNAGVEGKILYNVHGRDEVVKVVSGPKITGIVEKNSGKSRSEMAAGRSLDGKVLPDGTSDTVVWSSATWGDDSQKHGETTTRVSSLGRKEISTTEAWYPSYYYGNTLEGANQQGLSSSEKISISSKTLIPTIIFLIFTYF